MNSQLIGELERSQNQSTFLESLHTEREFRCFLLYLLDHPDDYPDIINSVAPLYFSEMQKLRNSGKTKKSREFSYIYDIFTNGLDPIDAGQDLSIIDRRNFLNSLIPKEFSSLKSEINRMKLPNNVFQSFAHTFSFYDAIEKENKELEKRIQALRNVRAFVPEALDVFIPRAVSAVSTPRTQCPSICSNVSSNKSISRVSTPRSQQSELSSARSQYSAISSARSQYSTYSTTKIQDKSKASSRINSHQQPQIIPRHRNPCPIDVNCKIDVQGNEFIRKQILSRENDITDNKKKLKVLLASIDGRRRDVVYLRREVAQLKIQSEQMEAETASQKEYQVMLDEHTKEVLRAKKKEANQATTNLKKAIQENRRLKLESTNND